MVTVTLWVLFIYYNSLLSSPLHWNLQLTIKLLESKRLKESKKMY